MQSVTKITIIVTLTAFCVVTNYVSVGVPNLKIMDFIVFIGGFCFGPFAGALIGILSWSVYGVINPYGFVPQVWLATMFSESIYGLIGGLLGKNFVSTDFNDQRLGLSILFGTMGLILTLIYDVITNVVYALTFGIPVIVAIIFGVPFAIPHEVGNAMIFGFGSVPLIEVVRKLLGGDGFGVSEK